MATAGLAHSSGVCVVVNHVALMDGDGPLPSAAAEVEAHARTTDMSGDQDGRPALGTSGDGASTSSGVGTVGTPVSSSRFAMMTASAGVAA